MLVLRSYKTKHLKHQIGVHVQTSSQKVQSCTATAAQKLEKHLDRCTRALLHFNKTPDRRTRAPNHTERGAEGAYAIF